MIDPDNFADLPLQPTGSGVADLEVAYEQMKLLEGDVPAADEASVGRDPDSSEVEAHPS